MKFINAILLLLVVTSASTQSNVDAIEWGTDTLSFECYTFMDIMHIKSDDLGLHHIYSEMGYVDSKKSYVEAVKFIANRSYYDLDFLFIISCDPSTEVLDRELLEHNVQMFYVHGVCYSPGGEKYEYKDKYVEQD